MLMPRQLQQLLNVFKTVSTHSDEARSESGKGKLRQLYEVMSLRFGPGRLDPEDYYLYGLHNDAEYSDSDKRAFISADALPDGIWARRSAVLADDKAIFYMTMAALSHPTPSIFGFYHSFRLFGSYPTFNDAESLIHFLETNAPYPLVIKPIQGIFSEDVIAISKFDPGQFQLVNDERIEREELFDFVSRYSNEGLIIQELLEPHATVRELCGPRLCTLRILVLNGPNGSRLFDAFWKIASNKNMADNFWREGNCLASLDSETGRVKRCVTGYNKKIQELDTHPETGNPLVGFHIPEWEAAKSLSIMASAALPGFPMLAWDVAITDNGPVLLEVNIVGSLFLPQLAKKSGLLNAEFTAFLNQIK